MTSSAPGADDEDDDDDDDDDDPDHGPAASMDKSDTRGSHNGCTADTPVGVVDASHVLLW